MEWLFILGLLLFLAAIPLKNYLFGFNRRRRDLYHSYLRGTNYRKYKNHSNHRKDNCGY